MRRALLVTLAAAACAAASCAAAPQPPTSIGSPSSTPSPISSAPPAPAPTPACTNARVVAGWPLARRAAALVVVPVRDFDVAGAAPVVRAGAGGILFLGTAPPPSGLAAQIRAVAAQHGSAGAPMVMADEEGGGVQRLAGAVTSMPWPQEMARTMTAAKVRALAATVGREMRALGVTVDLAPVLDVDARPGPSSSNPDGKRSFSGTASVASRYGLAFAEGLRDAGVLPVVKHFPGLGGSSGNTDVGPGQTLPMSSLRAVGLVPFRAAVADKAPAVMVANATVPGLTSLPASLSPTAITTVLRGQLGFHGLVLTDSLSAGAIRAATPSLASAAVRAVGAGADMVLFGSTLTPADVELLRPQNVQRSFTAIVDALVAAVRNGSLPAKRLDDAVLAGVTAKQLNLCH